MRGTLFTLLLLMSLVSQAVQTQRGHGYHEVGDWVRATGKYMYVGEISKLLQPPLVIVDTVDPNGMIQKRILPIHDLAPAPTVGELALVNLPDVQKNGFVQVVVKHVGSSEVFVQTDDGAIRVVFLNGLRRTTRNSEFFFETTSDTRLRELKLDLARRREEIPRRPSVSENLLNQLYDEPEVMSGTEIDNVYIAKYPDRSLNLTSRASSLAIVSSNFESTHFIPISYLLRADENLDSARIQVVGDLLSVHFADGKTRLWSIRNEIQQRALRANNEMADEVRSCQLIFDPVPALANQ